jgi:hypothetical protein
MKRIAVVVIATFISDPVVAQSYDPSIGTGNIVPGTVWQAPVGHRQPRAADVPQTNNSGRDNLSAYERDVRLERALRICRGC